MPAEAADREWVPTSFFLAASEDFTTEITFSPRQMLRDTGRQYASEICIYDPATGRPRHRLRSEPIAHGECFRTSSKELRPHLSPDTEFYYCEAFNFAVGAPPADVHVALPSNLHYFSRSGKLQGDLGSNYIFGAPRKAFKGAFYYDHFPLGRGIEGTTLKVFLMNPYVRPSAYRVMFTSRRRRNEVAAEGIVPGKSIGVVEVDSPVTRRPEDGLAVVVAGELKLNAIYGVVIKASGIMCGLDHGHPFLMQRLAH